jgi:hypothetical protein
VTTEQPAKPAPWWPTLFFAVMTVLMAILVVEESLRGELRWHTLILPALWSWITINRWSRTMRQRAGRPPWWVEHPRGTLVINVTTLVAVTGFWGYCLTYLGVDHPLYIVEAILCTLLIPFTVYFTIVQWRLRDAETDWPWWDQPWWRWRLEKTPNTE